MIRNRPSHLSEYRNRERRIALAQRRHRRGRAFTPERLEDRLLLSGMTYTVDLTSDTGAGSGTTGDLRYAITQANANAGSTIQFAVTGTIALSSALPDIIAGVTINGPGASTLAIDGTTATRVVAIDGAAVSISGLTIADGTVPGGGGGGGILNNYGTLSINSCTFTGNSANTGGAIENVGSLTVTDSTFSGNSANGGGAIFSPGTATVTNCTFSNNTGGYGGGAIINEDNLTVVGCTFYGNTVGGEGRGGAIYNYFATATITNSTFVKNSAVLGGGLDSYYSSTAHGAPYAVATLTDVTMTGSSGGGIDNEGEDIVSFLTLSNSVIAGNSEGDVIGTVNGYNSTYNLIGDGSQMSGISNGSDGNQVGTSSSPINAQLGTLDNYGGSTQTVPLLTGSPALDAASGAATTDTDQRGVARGQYLDIGAYQATASQLNVTGFPSPTVPGAAHTLTVSAVDSFGQASLDFNSSVTFSSSDPAANLPTGQSLVSGQGSFNATLNTPGVQSITATAGGLSGSQTGITVSGAATASFLQKDTTTQGTWSGIYGKQGYDIVSGPTSLPSNDTVAPSGQSTYTWTKTSSDPRALQIPGSSNRVAAVWYASKSFTVDVNLADGQTHDLELYFLDWDSRGRGEQVQISDAGSGTVLDTETISSFSNGLYLDWKVSGNLLITFTTKAGPNAVLNGLFLDAPSSPPPPPPATATFLQKDTKTQGTWVGAYGKQGYDIVSGPTSLPSNDTVAPSGQSTYTWTKTSSDPRALQIPGSSNRVAAVWYASKSFTVDVNLADGQTHDLELYFLDWDSRGRGEQVQISDAGSGTVLDTETISSFSNGVYLDWKVSGNLLITITTKAGPNAVLDGVFLDPPSSVPAYKVGFEGKVSTGTLSSLTAPGAALVKGSNPGLAAVPAAGLVNVVLGALPDDEDLPAAAASSSIHDLAVEHISGQGMDKLMSRRWRD